MSLATIVREWGRIGCIGFGGPPTHIKLLRELCVERRQWLDAQEFEDAIAACNLLPGPASTQLAIFCAWRLRGRRGALAGGVAFIVPGLIVILALAALFLGTSPPLWVLGAGAGAGAAVPAVAIQAGTSLTGASWQRRKNSTRWLCYLIAGAAAAATLGPWLVLVLLGCGVIELALQLDVGRRQGGAMPGVAATPMLAVSALGAGVLLSVAWVAFKVGALSYGGGFVIIPLMQSDAVSHYHWMTGTQFLNAVALGQITPGPVVQTVAVVGYAAQPRRRDPGLRWSRSARRSRSSCSAGSGSTRSCDGRRARGPSSTAQAPPRSAPSSAWPSPSTANDECLAVRCSGWCTAGAPAAAPLLSRPCSARGRGVIASTVGPALRHGRQARRRWMR